MAGESLNFGGEQLLLHSLPKYSGERIILWIGLAISFLIWLLIVPSILGRVRQASLVVLVCCVLGYLSFTSYIIFQSSNNQFTARGVFEAPLLTKQECQLLLERSYAAAERNFNDTKSVELSKEPRGWQKSRHKSYPTIDLNLVQDPFLQQDRDWLQNLLDQRLGPLLQRIYGVTPASIIANDLFIVRYTDDTRSFLASHTDDADISFNLLLSEDFEGGGTLFWNRNTGQPFAKIQPSRMGQVLIHSSMLLHEGLPVTSGVRHILVGFLSTDRIHPQTLESTGLSWFNSWWSLHFLHVKFKEVYVQAHRRLSKRKEYGIPDEQVHWTDNKYVRSFFRDIITFLEAQGDQLSSHRHYNLVSEDQADEFINKLDKAAESTERRDAKKANWFSHHQVVSNLDGSPVQNMRNTERHGEL